MCRKGLMTFPQSRNLVGTEPVLKPGFSDLADLVQCCCSNLTLPLCNAPQ